MNDQAAVDTKGEPEVEVEVEVEEPKPKPSSQLPERSKLGSGLKIQQGGGAVGVPMPSDVRELVEFSQLMSRAGPMVGKAFQDNPGACMGITLQAMRWGLDPYSCSQKAYQASKNDRDAPIAYESQLIHAVIIKNAPLSKRLRCTYDGEGSSRTITVVGYLDGDDEPFEYTSPPVEKIDKGGKGSPLWRDDPDQQLWYFGVRSWARKWVPEVVMGVYTPDEMHSIPDATSGGEIITLTGGGSRQDAAGHDEPADAEFTDVGKKLEADAKAKKAAKPKSEPKKSKPAAAGSNDGPGTDPQKDSSGGDDEANSDNATGEPDADSEGDEESDADFIKRIRETTPISAKRKAVDENRGAIARIAETAEDAELKKHAAGLLRAFEAKTAS